MKPVINIINKELAETRSCFATLEKKKENFILTIRCWLVKINLHIGVWPSGKAAGFGPAIRGFESSRPSSFFLL